MSKTFVICLIDDDDVYQFTFTKGLKESDAAKDILVFSDGEEALSFFRENISKTENLPDLIFLDIDMPIMDGWQFLDEFVSLKPKVDKKITIYMVSSSIDSADIDRAKAISEVSEYFVKPIDIDDLHAILDQYQVSQ